MGHRRTTELDDAIERVLSRYIPDTIWRIDAARELTALAVHAGLSPYTLVPMPTELPTATAERITT